MDPGPDAEPVIHPGFPPELWTPYCPFRLLQRPEVVRWVGQFARWQRYGPAVLGDDPDERTLRAFDVMSAALRLPRPKRKGA